ncbi:neoverrucotoxin subunit alpha-like, partial [Siphateles boraxobius]|uniref:neoverrucotoxin subunit alpha-like n=1 Tax=Siphateles boraxobius TaxID=180520 RepID=UPI004063400F
MEKYMDCRSQINTKFNVEASDSIKDKSKLLDIDGGMSLSVLGGLIEVSGAAKYLNDTEKSFIQQRLTLHYHSTCEFKELIINHLPSIQNMPDNYNDTATHVVTGLLYGANAYFIFDRKVSADEDTTTLEGNLKVAIEKLKGISVSGHVNLKMNDNEIDTVKNFECTFYGDFQLPYNPTSFEDALKVFADLPILLKENQELAVPLKVWLYPLDKLHSRASKLHKDINMNLITQIESVIESLNTTEMKCSDLMEDSPARTFAAFHDQIQQMKNNCCTYKLRLVKTLGSLLPNIRGDVMKETALNDLLQEHDKSPFRGTDLEEWLNERQRESEIIKIILRRLNDAGAQVELNVDAIWMGLQYGNLVSYTLTSLDCSDVLLSKQIACLSSSKQGETGEKSPGSKQKSWLTSVNKKTMKRNLKIFENLINSKESCKQTRFIVSSKEMENHPGSCIILYESECGEAVCFTPPSTPACPITEEVKGQSVVL